MLIDKTHLAKFNSIYPDIYAEFMFGNEKGGTISVRFSEFSAGLFVDVPVGGIPIPVFILVLDSYLLELNKKKLGGGNVVLGLDYYVERDKMAPDGGELVE